MASWPACKQLSFTAEGLDARSLFDLEFCFLHGMTGSESVLELFNECQMAKDDAQGIGVDSQTT